MLIGVRREQSARLACSIRSICGDCSCSCAISSTEAYANEKATSSQRPAAGLLRLLLSISQQRTAAADTRNQQIAAYHVGRLDSPSRLQIPRIGSGALYVNM